MNCPPALARWTTFAEKYVLSLFFFYLAFREIGLLVARLPLFAEQRAFAVGATGLFAIVVKHVLLLAFTSFAGATLLLNRPAVRAVCTVPFGSMRRSPGPSR